MTRSHGLTWQRPFLFGFTLFAAAACGGDATQPAPRVLTTVNVSVGSVLIEIGQMTVAAASGFDQDGTPIATGAVTWVSDAPSIAAVNPTTGLIFAIAPGTTRITATVDGKSGERTITVTKAPAIRINEVQPKGDTPAGWIEFYNPTAALVDMSEWTLVGSNFFAPIFTFPAGTVIGAGGYLVVEEATLPFRLDAPDELHLFSRFGVQVDGEFWGAQPATTFGRCPDGASEFVPTKSITKGSANLCP